MNAKEIILSNRIYKYRFNDLFIFCEDIKSRIIWSYNFLLVEASIKSGINY